MFPDTGKLLMVAGAVLLGAGVIVHFNLLPWLGRLPGDISIKRENFSFYFPLTTGLLVSALLTVILNLFRR